MTLENIVLQKISENNSKRSLFCSKNFSENFLFVRNFSCCAYYFFSVDVNTEQFHESIINTKCMKIKPKHYKNQDLPSMPWS